MPRLRPRFAARARNQLPSVVYQEQVSGLSAFHPVGIIVLGIQYMEAKFQARDKGAFSVHSRDDVQQGLDVSSTSIPLCLYIFVTSRIKLLQL